MSVAWTTLAIIVMLVPGIFFFIGVASYERLSREIIRSSVVSELAMAAMIAIALHTAAISIISAWGFRLSNFLVPFAQFPGPRPAELIHPIADRLLPLALYLMVLAAAGFSSGYVVAIGVLKGPLRSLATHKWIYDVIDSGRKGGIVTAYVMTTMVQDGKVLMYRGRVHELFLNKDGDISYVILKNCARFYMIFGEAGLTTSKQFTLFDVADKGRRWDYLFVEGENIANILFDPSPEKIRETPAGTAALQEELKKRQTTIVAARRQHQPPNLQQAPPISY
jgi:hypothetical protein